MSRSARRLTPDNRLPLSSLRYVVAPACPGRVRNGPPFPTLRAATVSVTARGSAAAEDTGSDSSSAWPENRSKGTGSGAR